MLHKGHTSPAISIKCIFQELNFLFNLKPTHVKAKTCPILFMACKLNRDNYLSSTCWPVRPLNWKKSLAKHLEVGWVEILNQPGQLWILWMRLCFPSMCSLTEILYTTVNTTVKN